MKKIERFMLQMLCDLLRPPEDRRINPDRVEKALTHGHLWALDWEFDGADPDKSEFLEETIQILNMWTTVEAQFERLSKDDRSEIAKAVERPVEDLRFNGFDANNEPHFGIATFMVKDFRRWRRFEGRKLNCHYPSIASHRRMLKEYKKQNKSVGTEFTVDQFIQIFNARKYLCQE